MRIHLEYYGNSSMLYSVFRRPVALPCDDDLKPVYPLPRAPANAGKQVASRSHQSMSVRELTTRSSELRREPTPNLLSGCHRHQTAGQCSSRFQCHRSTGQHARRSRESFHLVVYLQMSALYVTGSITSTDQGKIRRRRVCPLFCQTTGYGHPHSRIQFRQVHIRDTP